MNLFALRATDPRELRRQDCPTGPENDRYIDWTVGAAEIVICAWGAIDEALEWRARDVLDLILACANPMCLGYTKRRQPRHPLMLAYSTQLEAFAP